MSRGPACILACALALAVAACSGDDDNPSSTSSSSYRVTVSAADSLATGPERFVFLLQDARGQPVPNARVQLSFYFIDPVRDNRKTVKNTIAATPVELDKEYHVSQSDGNQITIGPGPTGIFANELAFDQAGEWVVDVAGSAGNSNLGLIEVPFVVKDTASGPRIGQVAPALQTGAISRPTMVIFGLPAVCETEVCGPLVEIARDVAVAHSDRIDLMAIEDISGEENEDWAVGAEPAVFFVDADGILRGHLHTIASREEVEVLALTILP